MSLWAPVATATHETLRYRSDLDRCPTNAVLPMSRCRLVSTVQRHHSRGLLKGDQESGTTERSEPQSEEATDGTASE